MIIDRVWEPFSKSSIQLTNRMGGGTSLHINKSCKLFNELKDNPDRLYDIPFYTKQKTMVRFRPGQYIGSYKQKGYDMMYGGVGLIHYDDNFLFIKMHTQRRKYYGLINGKKT